MSVPRNMNSLTFDKVPSGLTVIEDFVSEAEEQVLLNSVNWTQSDEHLGKYEGFFNVYFFYLRVSNLFVYIQFCASFFLIFSIV